MVSLEEFTAFVQCKAYDVLSDGAFKKHLVQSRENGEAWALQMHSRQNRVIASCRALQTKAGAAAGALGQVCKDVMSSAQPPIKVFTGYSLCGLTGAHLDYSIDLTRNSKGAQECHVHPRFWHFFVFLWFVAKLEYVARACTKQWAERNKEHSGEYTRLCEGFIAENSDLVDRLHRIFVKAIDYVTRSLQLNKEESAPQPVLQPPEVYMQSLADAKKEGEL